MLTYFFNDIGSECLYEHLCKCLKKDIGLGNIAVGERLPSKRGFAKNLNISTITVENAYSRLIDEGYIYSIPKKGYFVADLKIPAATKKKNGRICDSPSCENIKTDLADNHTNPETFPFSVWAKIMREVMANLPVKLMTNSPAEGVPELRQEIALTLKKFRGMNVSPDNIIVGAGTDHLYRLIIELLGYDLTYAVEDPGYKKLSRIYKGANAKCVFIPMDEKGINAESLRNSGAQVVHISPTHHFPTGIVTPISRRYELLGWAAGDDSRFIIEDDFDSEFRMTGTPIPSLQSIDVLDKVIYMNTFTKSLASTIRVSYMVLSDSLMEKFRREMSIYSNTVSTFEQYTLAEFLRGGYFETHINRMRKYYRTLRDSLLTAIAKSSLRKHVTISEENSGLHFLMHLNTDEADSAISERAQKFGIKLTFLSEYYHEPSTECEHTLVINYSGLKTENVEETVTDMENVLF